MAVHKQEFGDQHKQEVDLHQREQKNVKRTRITFDVSNELRRRIKIAAAESSTSVGDYLRGIIEKVLPDEPEKIEQERHPISRKSSERLHRLREKILDDRNGEKFEDSTEMIRQMREDRAQYLAESQREDTQK